MEEEIRNFIKVWILALASLCYCYYISAKISRGLPRFLSLIPVFYIFTFLPFSLYSASLGGSTATFLLWLGNFKLLLFSLDQGPLCLPPHKLSHFIITACLPIQVKQNPSSKTFQKTSPHPNPPSVPRPIQWGVKLLLLALVYHVSNYRQHLPKTVLVPIYCLQIYLLVELLLDTSAAPVRAFLRVELEPQFNDPYLATSLQDFWGRKWNLVVSGILRPTIYDPIRRISTGIVGPRWAALPAVIAVFVVSGLMHELIYYHLTRVRPTWEVTWFFIIHGICVTMEVAVKKVVRERWQLNPVISRPLTAVFMAATGHWLFFPQFLRNGIDEKLKREFSMFLDFVRGIGFAALYRGT
ncbi:hypothetical protein SLA2020_305090 [Shorea laevis]